MEDEIELIMSPLCQEISRDGEMVEVQIYGDGNGEWLLEVVDKYNNSTVWDDPFSTDAQAMQEVLDTIENEGIASLIGPEFDNADDAPL